MNESRHQLREEVYDSVGAVASGKLSPEWVELLMGWPRDWTKLDKEGSDFFFVKKKKGDTVKKTAISYKDDAEKAYAAWFEARLDPWHEKWEAGTSRVVKGINHRKDRLKCTGNGVVPLQSVPAWSLIRAIADAKDMTVG